MFKLLNFLVRKPGMSQADFRNYYETVHRPLAFKAFPQILKHVRNYPEDGGAMFPEGVDQPWDAIVEIYFRDRKGYEEMQAFMADPVKNKELVDDSFNFLDLARCGGLIVDEVVSDRS
ncbi:MAG: EthD domain-containing protein [Sphingomonadaceae bacterium]